MRALCCTALSLLGGCAATFELPRYRTSRPAPLAPAATATDPRQIALSFARIGQLTWIDNDVGAPARANFRLAVAAEDRRRFVVIDPARPGPAPCTAARCRRLGDLRSADVALSEEALLQLFCGWKARGVGQDAPAVCLPRDPLADRDAARRFVARAVSDLRQRGAAAGAHSIADIRCFGWGRRRRLWCEGVAAARTGERTPPASQPAAEESGEMTLVSETALAPNAFVIGATAEAGYWGGGFALASSIVFRYRPIEAALRFSHVAEKAVFAIGAVGLYRRELTDWGLGVIAGAEVAWGFPLAGGTAQAELSMLALRPFAGATWQSHTKTGAVEVFVDLVGGYLFVPARAAALADDQRIDGPAVSLTLGLNWPERR